MSGRMDEFRARECDVLGVSTDSVETHRRWLTTSPEQSGLGPIEFPLAADEEGLVSRQFGVYLEPQNASLRGLFIIDGNGVLQFQAVHSLSVGRSTDEVIRVLDALQTGGLCPGERQPGQATLDITPMLAPNRIVGQYRIETELGSGSFGTVYRAWDLTLERPVALKVLRAKDGDPHEALLQEARAAAALNHPNVCTIYSVDQSHGASMIVMEFIDAQPMAKRIQDGHISGGGVSSIIAQIASGLSAAHSVGVVHGDIKPANLMIAADNTVKIMDFGLARRFGTTSQAGDATVMWEASSSGLTGTPGYMAPEQSRGEPATKMSDVFSFGLVVYELLAGKPAISAKNILEAIRDIDQLESEQLAKDLPQPFQSIVQATTRAQANQRMTMHDVLDALNS